MTEYTQRKDHSRMAKDKMIEMLDIISMYIAEFIYVMGATKLGVYDQLVEFFQKTAYEKGLAVDGFLLDELTIGRSMVIHEMSLKNEGDFL